MDAIRFYLDESGTRTLGRSKVVGHTDPDWFAMGGVLIRANDVQAAEDAVSAFKARWPQIGSAPLHSSAIRSRAGDFRWLVSASAANKEAFMRDLTELMTALPITVLACVIDRHGYAQRYEVRYRAQPWALCKTAFSIAVERATKFALAEEKSLRIYVERSSKRFERLLLGYYQSLRKEGLPFDPATSAKYQPVSADTFKRTLIEFRVKKKDSTLMQIADLALWPVCIGGYDPENRAYVALRDAGKLLDRFCTPANGLQGVKYSCFELAQKAKSPRERASGAATHTTGG